MKPAFLVGFFLFGLLGLLSSLGLLSLLRISRSEILLYELNKPNELNKLLLPIYMFQ